MHIRALITLAIALIMGGITVFLVNHYLQREVSHRAAAKVIDTVPVVVATTDLKTGMRLEKLHMKTVDWPSNALPQNAYHAIDKALGEKPPIILTEIRTGEPILPYKLSPHGARGGLPAKIPEDMRAVTISVNEISGVAGFVMPGDFVDVLHTTDKGRKDKTMVTRVILQNVEVLGIDQISSEDESQPRVVNAVTLLVSQQDAQRMTLAQSLGSLNLALRNEFDASLLEHKSIDYKDLLTAEPERKKAKVIKRVRRQSVEIIRGLEITKKRVTEENTPETKSQATAGEKQ